MTEDLISVCIVSYNSQKTIINTLNSIYLQSYKNIELIVSDDCSTDNTISIVKDWFITHSERFINTKIISVEKNTGVTGNVNRACIEAIGNYIKIIAADDQLLPNYLELCIKKFNSNNNIQALFTKVKFVAENNSPVPHDVDYSFFYLSAEEQFKAIILSGAPFIPTPSVIYKKEVFDKVGLFDERIPMWEDGPFYYTLTKNGIKLNLLEEELVTWTVRSDSLSNSVPYRHRKSIALFYFYDLFKEEIKIRPIKASFHLIKFSFLYHSNKKICNYIYNLLCKKNI